MFDLLESGGWRLHDLESGCIWRGPSDRFGTVFFDDDSVERSAPILPGYAFVDGAGGIQLSYHGPAPSLLALRFSVRLEGNRVEISYCSTGAGKIRRIRLMDGLVLRGADSGFVLPVRSGLHVDADCGKRFSYSVGTYVYEGLDLAMFGALQEESSLLIQWDDPYPVLTLEGDGEGVSATLEVSHTASRISLHVLGNSGVNGIAEEYREVAREKGHLVTWHEKTDNAHECAKLFGAVNFKIWFCMSKRVNLDLKVESSEMRCSFEEAAEIAEHLKEDLHLGRVLFILGGWSTMGYDVQHPDVMPANEECGGNDGLRSCADRVKELGYLFGLHDNYQDMYRDAPSWDEDYLMRMPDGSLNVGDIWDGGLAFRICSQRALELAGRDRNMPAIKKEINPSAFFTDTTFAARLYECFSSDHPLTLWDDMYYKTRLAHQSRELFGIYGSECGREWALGVADFFEGAAGASGRCYHHLNPPDICAVSLPLFEMVYHDCIANYGKYAYSAIEAADYVAHHAVIGRTLNYHFQETERGRYWEMNATEEPPQVEGPDRALYARGHSGWAAGLCKEDRFIKNTYELLSPFNLLTTHQRLTDFMFLTSERTVYCSRFGDAATSMVNRGNVPATVQSKVYGEITLPPYGVFLECDTFMGFCSLSFGGVTYDSPVLFTVQSEDGKPLSQSRRIRVFHGFGEAELAFGGVTYSVTTEKTITR